MSRQPISPFPYFGEQKIPTQIKHRILERYLSAWGGIICGKSRSANLAFVDTCAGPGSYLDTRGKSEVLGSPLIALQTLSELKASPKFSGKTIKTKSLLIEKDPSNALALKNLLHSGNTYGEEYDIKESEFSLILQEVLEFTKGSFGFIFADPFGPSSIPFDAISPVVSQRFNDVLINYPFYSIQKWSGFIDDYDKDVGAKLRVDYVTNFFGSNEWINIYHRYQRTEEREKEWINLYLGNLKALGVYTTSVPLRFEQRERNIFYLIFTSYNLAGLIAMKDTMSRGKDEEAKRRIKLQSQMRHPQQPSFSDINEEWLLADTVAEIDTKQLAQEIRQCFGKGRFTRKQIYERLILDTPYLQGDIDKALTALKRTGQAEYTGSTKFDQTIELK